MRAFLEWLLAALIAAVVGFGISLDSAVSNAFFIVAARATGLAMLFSLAMGKLGLKWIGWKPLFTVLEIMAQSLSFYLDDPVHERMMKSLKYLLLVSIIVLLSQLFAEMFTDFIVEEPEDEEPTTKGDIQ